MFREKCGENGRKSLADAPVVSLTVDSPAGRDLLDRFGSSFADIPILVLEGLGEGGDGSLPHLD